MLLKAYTLAGRLALQLALPRPALFSGMFSLFSSKKLSIGTVAFSSMVRVKKKEHTRFNVTWLRKHIKDDWQKPWLLPRQSLGKRIEVDQSVLLAQH